MGKTLRGLFHFTTRVYLNAAQLVCGLLLLLRAEPAECDQALWLFVVVEGGVAAVNVLVFGVAEWCIVAGADGDYLEALHALYASPVHSIRNIAQAAEMGWLALGAMWILEADRCDESLLLLSRVVVAVGWLVMLFQCCCLPCVTAVMAGEEVADHVIRRLSFRVPCWRGGVWATMRVAKRHEDAARRRKRIERHQATKFGLRAAAPPPVLEEDSDSSV